MFGFKRKTKDDLTDLEMYKMDGENTVNDTDHDVVTEDEQLAVALIDSNFNNAKASRDIPDDSYFSIEDNWEDEYKIFKGGGLQWSLNFAYRRQKDRKIRPNAEDNFVFNTINIQHANITADTPTINITGVSEDDKEIAEQLTCISRHNDNKNNFKALYKRWVYDFLISGPTIAKVTWDNELQGGRGPERWIGDVKLERIDKFDMFFDPAIVDLEENLESCEFVAHRARKKLSYIRDRWKKGKLVGKNLNEDELTYEGGDPDQAYVIEYWHKGFPFFVTDERKKELMERAKQLEAEGEIYKAKDYYDAAKGVLDGVHVAYVADGVLLEYSPYAYEHSKYPFVFTTRYNDDKNQWGYGEVRNIKIPQVMHNKADEIEVESMVREGTAGNYYQKGSVNPKQIDKIMKEGGKPGVWLEVDNVELIRPRTGPRVPSSITNYKEHKQRIIETVSQVTPIQQGMSPGSNVPFATVEALGARADVRMRQIANKLEDFIKKINQLRIELFTQFYTEDRYYRVKGSDGKTDVGVFNVENIRNFWARDTYMEDVVDPTTGETYSVQKEQLESFIPEFDVEVTVISEKPTDRNYYTNLAFQLYNLGLLTIEDLYETLEEGSLPPNEELLKRLYAVKPLMGSMAELQQLPEQAQEFVNQQIQQVIQQATMATQMLEQQQQQPQQQQF